MMHVKQENCPVQATVENYAVVELVHRHYNVSNVLPLNVVKKRNGVLNLQSHVMRALTDIPVTDGILIVIVMGRFQTRLHQQAVETQQKELPVYAVMVQINHHHVTVIMMALYVLVEVSIVKI